MDQLSYVAPNLDELFENSPPNIQEMIHGEDLNKATVILGKLYKLPIGDYVALENIISFILIGALKPEDAVRAIMDLLEFKEEDAYRLAADLDTTILEKARISILGKSPKDMVTLTFQEGRSEEDLRTEILDTTKREPVTEEPQAPPATPSAPVTGSRSQLMEQLQVLGSIPDDEEVAERLKKIQEQISGIETSNGRELDSNIALQEFMPKETDELLVPAEAKSATYSKAPTKYNVDPYREGVEE